MHKDVESHLEAAARELGEARHLLKESSTAADPVIQTPPPNQEACLNLTPMQDWVQIEQSNLCKPCIIAPVIAWYIQELNEGGQPQLANELQGTSDKENPTECARAMDNIKDRVSPEMKRRLQEFDCAAQSYIPTIDEISEVSPSA